MHKSHYKNEAANKTSPLPKAKGRSQNSNLAESDPDCCPLPQEGLGTTSACTPLALPEPTARTTGRL